MACIDYQAVQRAVILIIAELFSASSGDVSLDDIIDRARLNPHATGVADEDLRAVVR